MITNLKIDDRLLDLIRSPRAIPRQLGALAIGFVQYQQCDDRLGKVVKALLLQGDPAAKVRIAETIGD